MCWVFCLNFYCLRTFYGKSFSVGLCVVVSGCALLEWNSFYFYFNDGYVFIGR